MKKSVLSQIVAFLALVMLFTANVEAQSSKIPSTLSGKAREYYVGAQQGDEFSQLALAVCYQNGDCAPQDGNQAVYWYQKAAEKGNVIAQYNLGDIYDEGVIVPRNYEMAAFWYQKAALQGDALAQCGLGSCYFNGEGMKQDYKNAFAWFEKAANPPQ